MHDRLTAKTRFKALRKSRFLDVGKIFARVVFLALRDNDLLIRKLAHNGADRDTNDGCRANAAMTERQRQWTALQDEEDSFLKKVADESDLDVDALVVLCNRLLKAAHTDLRGGYGIEK